MTPNRSHSANSLQYEGNIIEIDCLYVAERPGRNLDRFPGLTLWPPGIVCVRYGAYGFTPLYKIRARAKKKFPRAGPNLSKTKSKNSKKIIEIHPKSPLRKIIIIINDNW